MSSGMETLTRLGGHLTVPPHLSGTRKTERLYRPPLASQLPVVPGGKQNLSLSSPPGKVWLSAKTLAPVGTKHKKSLTRKAASVAEKTNELVEETSHMTLLGMKMARMARRITHGTTHIPNEAFNTAFEALEGINIATKGISFIKSTGKTVYGAVKDAAAHGRRKEARALLKTYDPQTRGFDQTTRTRQRKKLKTLMAEKGSDLSRSKSQIAIDRLTQIAGQAQQATGITHSAMLLAQHSSQVAARALPGVSIAVAAMSTVQSAVKTGSQIGALNNLARAKAATEDPLLHALAGHIKQERTLQARKHLASTAVNFASTGVAIGLTASGVGAPAAFIATGAIGAAVSIGGSAFSAWHHRKLNKNRQLTDALMEYRQSTSALATHNIGVAEKAFLLRLRHARGEKLKEVVDFLRHFGLTDGTIKKLQLAPREAAMKKLREVLYQDKVKYQGLQLKQTAKTLSHVVGLSALGKRIKNGSLWLKARLMPSRNKSRSNAAGDSLKSKHPMGRHQRKAVTFVHPERVRPAVPLSLNHPINR